MSWRQTPPVGGQFQWGNQTPKAAAYNYQQQQRQQLLLQQHQQPVHQNVQASLYQQRQPPPQQQHQQQQYCHRQDPPVQQRVAAAPAIHGRSVVQQHHQPHAAAGEDDDDSSDEEYHRIRTVNAMLQSEGRLNNSKDDYHQHDHGDTREDRGVVERFRRNTITKTKRPPCRRKSSNALPLPARKKRKIPKAAATVANSTAASESEEESDPENNGEDEDEEEEEDEEDEEEEEDEGDATTKHTAGINNNNPRGSNNKSTFGNKENPLLSSYGMIDGRSNAQACFEQKVQLCKEFQQEHGHLRIPQFPTDPKSKYRRLYAFLINQRKFYRRQLRGETVPQLTKERIAMLDELGEWISPVGAEKWPDMFQQLTDFYNEYGHCCVSAVPSYQENNKDLVSFAQKQRLHFKGWKEKQEWLSRSSSKKEQEEETEARTTTATETATAGGAEQEGNRETISTSEETRTGETNREDRTDKIENEKDPDDGKKTVEAAAHLEEDGDDNNTSQGAQNNDKENDKGKKETNGKGRGGARQEKSRNLPACASPSLFCKPSKKGVPAFQRISAYYDQEKHDALAAMQCPYIESYDKMKDYRFDKVQLFTTDWFVALEQFKQHRRDNPDDLILAYKRGSMKWSGLQWWVWRQRKVYKAIQGKKLMEKNGPVRKFFSLLMEEHNLLLDPEKVKLAEEEVTRKERIEEHKKEQEAKRLASPEYKLEVALEKEAAAKEKVREAMIKLKEAEALVKAAQSIHGAAQAEVQDLRKQIEDSNDGVGDDVFVKTRGGGKPRGKARILKITERKIGNLKPMKFFDLKFDSGATEKFVDGMFVCRLDCGTPCG